MNYGCKKGYPHNFKQTGDYADAVVDVCLECGEKGIYNKVAGTIDNKKYLEKHIRDTCQPYGPTSKVFELIYGTKRLMEIRQKDAARGTNSLEDLMKDSKNYIKKKTI